MAGKKKVNLTKSMTWAGTTYPVGAQELPEAGAAYAVRRNFGKIAGETAKAPETGTENTGGEAGEGTGNNENGLPEEFPMKHVFEGLGFKSVEEIQAKSREELIDLDGVGEKTADKALAYGK